MPSAVSIYLALGNIMLTPGHPLRTHRVGTVVGPFVRALSVARVLVCNIG